MRDLPIEWVSLALRVRSSIFDLHLPGVADAGGATPIIMMLSTILALLTNLCSLRKTHGLLYLGVDVLRGISSNLQGTK